MKAQSTREVQLPAQKKHKSKKRRRIFLLVKALLITALLATTLVYGALSPFFNIKEIVVKGDPIHYSRQMLVDRSGVTPGINGFRLLFHNPGRFWFFRAGYAEKAILEKCPYVKKVTARYILPSKLTIQVTEREAAAVLTADGTTLLVDGEETLLEVDPDLKKIDLPVIKIKRPVELKPGKRLALREDAIPTAMKVYGGIREIDSQNEDKLLPEVDFVDVSDPDKVGFSLQSRLLVNLGNLDDMVYKLNAVKTVFANNIKKDERGKLDFNSEGNPIFTPESGR